MFCKIPPSESSGTGNATIHIIALKNTSTAPRSQTFVVTSATGIVRSVIVHQEGVKKDLYLSFPSGSVSTSISVGQVFFISADGPDMVQAEFYHKLGTVKSVTSSQIVIDMSGLTQTDIDNIYDDLNTGDMIEMDEIFFGIAMGDDPTAQWFPIVKTTETSGAAGTYNNASQYVAESITQSYDGTPITLNCTAVDGGAASGQYAMIFGGNLKIADIEIEPIAFSDAGVDSLYVIPTLVFSNGTEKRSSSPLKLDAGMTYSSGELKFVLPEPLIFNAATSISKIRLDVSTSSTPSSSTLFGEMEANSDLSSVQFTNDKIANTYYKATIDDVSGSLMEIVFTTPIPIVKSTDVNIISFAGTKYPIININSLA